jgi:hypothetical protein
LVEKLNAYADGINYYLYKTQQSNLFYYNTSSLGIRCCGQTGIGAISMGDLNTGELKAFYSGNRQGLLYRKRKKYPNWIRQFALAPSKQPQKCYFIYQSSHKLLFQTRDTNQQRRIKCLWSRYLGAFFIYQGFNENCGWMHTSSSVMYLIYVRRKNSD